MIKLSCLLWCLVLACPTMASGVVTSIQLRLTPDAGPAVEEAARIFTSQVTRRCRATVGRSDSGQLVVELAIDSGIGAEGYRIADGTGGAIRIVGGDQRGLLYGVGKFLRTSRYDQEGFTPGTWRGASAPQCPFRAVYAATHFGNYYEAAPTDEVVRYAEELALWGANALIVHFPTWQFTGFDDPAAKKNLERIGQLLTAGKHAGMRVGLVLCPNQGFSTAPNAVRAQKFPDDMHRRGDFGVNCCPSIPEGHEYLLTLYGRLIAEYRDIGLDYLVCWPYDEGGCGCKACWPWGAEGYPRISHELANLARTMYPHLEVVLSTWVYDTPPAGEWEGLARFLDHDKAWLNYIMADSHGDFPRYPLDKGSPGGLRLVNFPEISMWGRGPWGAYGANPLPARYENLWRQTGGRLDGGMPYSEGIYEDINKTICLQFYWDKNRSAEESLREYIAFEYSPDVVSDVLKAVQLLEKTWPGRQGSPEARRLICQAESRLTPNVRTAWRWRILVLRTVIDEELARTQGKYEGVLLKEAFAELTRIYHAEQAHPNVRPPVVKESAK